MSKTKANQQAFQPDHYINRELSWLEFNARVLEEAQDPTTPLLERVKFLSIFSSNLDEFFMVRVAGLREQAFASEAPQDYNPDGLKAISQLRQICGADATTGGGSVPLLDAIPSSRRWPQEGIVLAPLTDVKDTPIWTGSFRRRCFRSSRRWRSIPVIPVRAITIAVCTSV